ncbi:hypothetical protein N7527_008841 [Penicillium freii]|nr:hypothetical protein N7527_008841 [Penicillium freii]
MPEHTGEYSRQSPIHVGKVCVIDAGCMNLDEHFIGSDVGESNLRLYWDVYLPRDEGLGCGRYIGWKEKVTDWDEL